MNLYLHKFFLNLMSEGAHVKQGQVFFVIDQVPPMLLVTFVENCFKHGVSPVEKSDI